MQKQGLPDGGDWWAVFIDIPESASVADFVFRCTNISILYMESINRAHHANPTMKDVKVLDAVTPRVSFHTEPYIIILTLPKIEVILNTKL